MKTQLYHCLATHAQTRVLCITTSTNLNQPAAYIAGNLQTVLWNSLNQIHCKSVYYTNDNSITKNQQIKQIEDKQKQEKITRKIT